MILLDKKFTLLRSALIITPALLVLSGCSGNEKKTPIITPPVVVVPTPPETLITNLVEATNKANKRVGAAVSNGVLNNNETNYIDILKAEFNYITPENIGKWGSIQNLTADVWDFLYTADYTSQHYFKNLM